MAGAEGFEPPLAVLETAGLPLNLRPCITPCIPGGNSILLDFLVRLVLAAVPAELLHFQTLGGRLLVLGRRVVPVLALRALERDDVSRHCLTPSLRTTAQHKSGGLHPIQRTKPALIT